MQSGPQFQDQQPRPTLIAPRPIDVTQLATTETVVAIAREDADFEVRALVFANVTGSAVAISVHLAPTGEASDLSNAILFGVGISANDQISLADEQNRILIQPGYSIRAVAGAASAVNVYGHGMDYQGQIV